MPSWRAMARREIPVGPPSASCARAAVLMSAIVSCRRRSRRLGRTWGEDRLTTRAACPTDLSGVKFLLTCHRSRLPADLADMGGLGTLEGGVPVEVRIW